VTENKLTVGALVKIVVFTILALLGFFGLWAYIFFLSLALTLDIGLSLILGLFISGVTISALVTILTRSRWRHRPVSSKRQRVGAYVVCAIVFILGLPLTKTNPQLFLINTMSSVVLILITTCDILREGGVAQK